MKTGIELIAEERKRQIEAKGWTAEHDDMHYPNILANAGACYAIAPTIFRDSLLEELFPFNPEYWKPTPDNRIRELQKAGALIAAEIDRLQRLNNK